MYASLYTTISILRQYISLPVLMVLLTVTPAAKAAIERYLAVEEGPLSGQGSELNATPDDLRNSEVGSPISHDDLIEISKALIQQALHKDDKTVAKEWRLESLLKGAKVYQEPPPSKPEPTTEYKALMKRLRAEEEQRQYERMINPVSFKETFDQRFPQARYTFNPATSIGQAPGADEVDEVTYADVKRQVTLIINVLVSIVCCSIAIWVVARRWSVPQRLGLSMSGSTLVGVAEVAIYMGYIRRIKEAKVTERKKVERKEIVETWVLDGNSKSEKSMSEHVRYRKGKHRQIPTVYRSPEPSN